MARQPDPDLEDRILNAARKLWKQGAGKALTMRAVARAAGTNTPAVSPPRRYSASALTTNQARVVSTAGCFPLSGRSLRALP